MSEKKEEKDNTIFCGKKDFLRYVGACEKVLEKYPEVKLSARGRNIQRAVDLSQAIVNKFMKDKVELTNVELGTEIMKKEDEKTKEEREINVSTIDITLKKK